MSQPHPWRFGVPGTVSSFGFKVYVSTELPAERGVLRWQYEHGRTSRTTSVFTGVWGLSRDQVWATAGSAVLAFQRGSGDPLRYHWTPVAEAPATLNAIWGTSRSDIYAAGDSGVVMRFDGNRWSVRRAPSAPHQLSGLWSGGADVWAVGRRQESGATDVDGLILHSTSAGESWIETVSAGDGKRYLRDVFRAGSRVYAVGYEDPLVAGSQPRAGVVLVSPDGGQTWADSLFTGPGALALNTVWADGADSVWIGGEVTPPGGSRQAIILLSTDGGQTWSSSTHAFGYIWSMWRIPGGDLLAAGGGNLLTNDGSGWSPLTQGCQTVGAGWRGIWASSPDDVFMVASTAAFYREQGCMHLTAAGVSYFGLDRAASVAMTPSLGVVAGSSTQLNQEDFTPFERAMLVTSAYYGPGITPAWGVEYEGADSSAFEDVWLSNPSQGAAVGWKQVAGERRALLLRRVSTGWVEVTPAAGQDVPLYAVWGRDAELFAFGVRAGSPAALVVLRSTDGGVTWNATAIPYTGAGTPRVTDAWGSSASAIHVSGYGEGAADESFTLRYDGTSWTLSVAADGARLTGAWSSGQTVVMSGYRAMGSGGAGFVRVSSNGGAAWSEQALPATGADGRVEGIWGASLSSLYAVGAGGKVYRYDGSSWSTMLGTGGSDFLGVAGAADTHVVAVGAGGVIYRGTR